MKNLRETIKTIIREESEYQQFFRKALEKAGKSITDMSDEEKKAFFNKIDAAWDGKGEKNEGNAFGAAVVAAKKAGEDEFEVGGKTYKVEVVTEAKKYDIGMGRFGNGVTVYNRAEEQWGDYKTIAHISDNGTVKYYDKSLPSNIKKMIEKHASKMKESKLTEGKYDSQLDKIEAAVKNASSFMGVGAELKKAGIKYDFTTSMIPMYMIKVPGNTIAIVNKKYASEAEREVGDTAIGLLEGFIKATKKSVTESKFKKGDKLKHKTSNTGTFVVLDDSNGLKVKNLNTGRVFNNLLNKDEYEIVTESKFKSGDKVTVKYPTLTKPLNGVVSTVLKGPDGDIVVLKGKNGVWDAKHVTLNEGNAFGMAVTKAKQEGKKEFEFNGKKYKVKKGSYEKNEAAKKLAEKKK